MALALFIDNTGLVELFRLKAVVNNAFIDDATVTLTLVDAEGNEVGGQVWPITLEFVEASSGDYIGVLPKELVLEADAGYLALIDADAGVGRFGHWEIPVVAKIRRT